MEQYCDGWLNRKLLDMDSNFTIRLNCQADSNEILVKTNNTWMCWVYSVFQIQLPFYSLWITLHQHLQNPNNISKRKKNCSSQQIAESESVTKRKFSSISVDCIYCTARHKQKPWTHLHQIFHQPKSKNSVVPANTVWMQFQFYRHIIH